jgi:hypothetical protein
VLERRLVFVRRNMNAQQFYIENLANALSQYRATQRPMFLWDTRLSGEELTLAGVHEMVHAVLHPPGSTPLGKNETPVEERIAHNVAGRACTHFGVTSYPDFVMRWQLDPSHVEDDEHDGVELLLAALITTLEAPDDAPSWMGRGNHSFGITSLEHSWAEASATTDDESVE